MIDRLPPWLDKKYMFQLYNSFHSQTEHNAITCRKMIE
jgi:hypothetical protein